jgi:hypothetical protein
MNYNKYFDLRGNVSKIWTKVVAPMVDSALMNASQNIQMARNRIAAEESARWLEENAPNAEYFHHREDLLHKSVSLAKPDGLYCEFGVAEGYSLNLIASWTKAEVHGFDSFEGLPTDWWQNGFKIARGTFKQDNLPKVPPNVKLHKGWFTETVPAFHKEHLGQPAAFLHLDADVYTSEKAVLDVMVDHIVPGTVMEFDELLNYPGWKANDFRAFSEFAAEHDLKYQPIGYSRHQFALQVESIRK